MDYISIGPAPYDEDCAQVGTDSFKARAVAECNLYREALRAHYGKEPFGAALTVKAFPHDFGQYYEVVCWYQDDVPEAVEYAYKCEEGLAKWPATGPGSVG